MMLISGLLDFLIADRATGGFNEPCISGNAFVDSETLGFKLSQVFGFDLIHGFLGPPAVHKSGRRLSDPAKVY
jgi:hypothetical protein